MTRSQRMASVALSVTLGLALGACGPGGGPAASDAVPVTPSVSAASVASSEAGATPPASAAAASASLPVGSVVACPVAEQTGVLPSDRLVDLSVASTPTHDLVTFVFATGSAPGPGGPPQGTLTAGVPPFSFAGSGQTIALLGGHALQLRFSGMTIADETGEATYHGPTDVKPDLPALREAIQFDASEGIVGWYVGYDGPGCVTLVREGNDVTVLISHPQSPAG